MHHLSLKYGRLIEKQVIVMNLKNMAYSLDTRALSTFQKIVALDEKCYPETLEHFLVINAPWYENKWLLYADL